MRTQLDSFSTQGLGDLEVIESVSKCLNPKLDRLKGLKIIFSRDDKKLVPSDGWGLKGGDNSATVTIVRSSSGTSIVAAVDSSCIKVAETEDGSLYAVKCGIATAVSRRALMHFKIGPVLFYLDEYAARESELEQRLAKVIMLDDEIAKRLVRVRAERAVQMELASHLAGAIILIDGSLRSSIFEERRRSIASISEQAALRGNTIIGLSKSTRLRALVRAGIPLSKIPGPAFLEVDAIVKGLLRSSIGSNLMVRLDNNGPVMRADIVGSRAQESIGKLVANDAVSNGYPETLRLAHHVSTFTRTEITCLRSHVLNNYGVKELASEDVRRTLLGSILV